jgi:hypothetical protein
MNEPSEHFRAMAERIERNAPEEFAGALLVVPPGAEEPIAILLVNPKQDLAAFWATVASTIQVAAAEFQQRMQNPDPFGRR